jgi:hypothetical protein
MVADKISVDDIKRIGREGSLSVRLPSYAACVSAKNIVTYVKKAYPREDGLTYTCSIDCDTNTIVIKTIEKKSNN